MDREPLHLDYTPMGHIPWDNLPPEIFVALLEQKPEWLKEAIAFNGKPRVRVPARS